MSDRQAISVTLEAAELGFANGSPDLLRQGPLSYDPRVDELVMTVGPTAILRIRPGRGFGRIVAGLMAQAETQAEERDAAMSQACPDCGAPVIEVTVGLLVRVVLNARPDPTGIYLMTRPGRARVLRPLETPMGVTYAAHHCVTGGTRE